MSEAAPQPTRQDLEDELAELLQSAVDVFVQRRGRAAFARVRGVAWYLASGELPYGDALWSERNWRCLEAGDRRAKAEREAAHAELASMGLSPIFDLKAWRFLTLAERAQGAC